jgi:hypothetical protein
VPLASIFLTHLFSKQRLKRKDLQEIARLARRHCFEAIRDILKPYDANLMRKYPVSRKLNNSKIDDAESASRGTLDTPTQERLF